MEKPAEPQFEEIHQTPLEIEMAQAAFDMQSGRWEELTGDKFPLMAQNMPIPLAKLRLDGIVGELQMVGQGLSVVADNAEALAISRGRIKQLRDAWSRTIIDIYPDVEPLTETQETVNFTENDASLLSFAVGSGADHLLEPKIIPSLQLLTQEQIVLYKLEALEARRNRWQTFANSNINEENGFKKNAPSLLDKLAKAKVKEIEQQMEKLASELPFEDSSQ